MILASQENIKEYTDKGWWGSKTLLDYFTENAAKSPDREALVDPLNKQDLAGLEPERLSYATLEKKVNAAASQLVKRGLKKDDIVMVQLPNCWELAMLYLAITRAGGLISPVPLQWRKKELSYIADLTQARFFITLPDFKGFSHLSLAEQVKSGSSFMQDIFTLAEIREMSQAESDPGALEKISVDANDIFTLCWTSGTEAEPKGCPLSHNNWINQSSVQAESAGIYPGDIQLTAGPLVNMASVGTTFIPWIILGGTFVLHHPFDPQIFIQQMIKEKVNYTLLVPAVANMIVKHPQVDTFDLSAVRAITLGSAPPSLFTMQEFKRRWNIDIGNIWGQNEGTGIVSGPKDVPEMEMRVDHLPQFGAKGAKWTSKVATEGIRTKLISPDTGLEVTEVGEVGELAYKGPNIIPGYFRRPDMTERAFDSEGYFYTGDLFVLSENHFIRFFERKKDIIVRGGFNISAQEVENAILAHPKVVDAAVVGRPDEILGEKTCVFVVPARGETVELKDITGFLEEQGMAKYKFPEFIEIVDSLPRTPVGKLLKKDLRQALKGKTER